MHSSIYWTRPNIGSEELAVMGLHSLKIQGPGSYLGQSSGGETNVSHPSFLSRLQYTEEYHAHFHVALLW